MQKNARSRTVIVFAALLFILIISFILNLCVGTVQVDMKKILEIFFTGTSDIKSRNIIMDIRLPRALMTLILGGGLAVSGFLLQTYFANPIAGPYILGISSGAKMTVALFLIFIVGRSGKSSSVLLVLTAFAGSIIATGFIILISNSVKNMASLLAAGIMIGYICSSVTDFLIAFADDSDIVNLHSWSQGSFSGADMKGALFCFFLVGITMVLVMLLSKSLDAFRLGENYARSVGVNVRVCRVAIILMSSILSACVTAYAGPVSFIGIAVPFLMRESLKSSKPIILIPASFMAGSIFCLLSDLLARRIFAPTELNISAVTSLFGAPIVIFMIIRRHRNREN
ncbi:iron complex transport system permease protein [Lachnospiraceae bacterium]|nr:iron complex transport system permease protein [Lachnospiraceae bacterium]